MLVSGPVRLLLPFIEETQRGDEGDSDNRGHYIFICTVISE
jgi:hypothetical protein